MEVEYFRFLDKYYETEGEAYKDALEWLNKEVNATSLDDIAYLLALPDRRKNNGRAKRNEMESI